MLNRPHDKNKNHLLANLQSLGEPKARILFFLDLWLKRQRKKQAALRGAKLKLQRHRRNKKRRAEEDLFMQQERESWEQDLKVSLMFNRLCQS